MVSCTAKNVIPVVFGFVTSMPEHSTRIPQQLPEGQVPESQRKNTKSLNARDPLYEMGILITGILPTQYGKPPLKECLEAVDLAPMISEIQAPHGVALGVRSRQRAALPHSNMEAFIAQIHMGYSLNSLKGVI